MTNWEKYFGTPERAAETMADRNDYKESCICWAIIKSDLKAAVYGNTQQRMCVYKGWLESEADDG